MPTLTRTATNGHAKPQDVEEIFGDLGVILFIRIEALVDDSGELP